MIDWFEQNWLDVIVPLAVFLAFFIISLWVRSILFNALSKWQKGNKFEGLQFIIQSSKTPFFYWFLLLGAYVSIQISILSDAGKLISGRIIASIFTASVFWLAITLSEKLIRFYLYKYKIGSTYISWAVNFSRIAFIVAGVLIILDIWGAPTTPLLLILATIILVIILASRNAILNIFSGFELTRGNLLKTGDYIKLNTSEEGYVVDISWDSTRIKALDNSIIVIPNNKLIQNSFVNYGHPLKKASQPFNFYTRAHLKEATGLKAKNIIELAENLKSVPDAVIYYHTHHFLEEYHFLTPEPANDFSLWVGDVADDPVLSEKLASIDTYEFTNINALRAKIIAVIEEHLSTSPSLHDAPRDLEFYFIKSVGIIMPTPFAANDLREFVEILRKVSINSLNFHMFESRLRLGKGVNDFSVWLKDSLGEDELANNISKLDPYNYTLNGLRSAIIQLIEKRIK